MEEFGDRTLYWTRFDKVVVGLNANTRETGKKIQEVFNETLVVEFISYFKLNLKKFIKHNYVTTWEDM
jgi:hypothetical protein